MQIPDNSNEFDRAQEELAAEILRISTTLFLSKNPGVRSELK